MVEIIDKFLTDQEFNKAWEIIRDIKWSKKHSIGSINRQEIDIPFLFNKLCFGECKDYFCNITRMDNDMNPSMKWHKDIYDQKVGIKLKLGQQWIGQALQWIIYMGGEFTGGLLQTRSREDIEPKTNRFVILDPFLDEHKVTRVIGLRYTLNGFIYKYKEI